MSMSERFDKLFERMKLEFKKQTMELTYSLTTNISLKLENKLKPLKQENQALKLEIEALEKKISYLERDNKRNNIIIFGFEEKETCVSELLQAVIKKMVEDLKISVMKCDINNVYRVGKRKTESTKPRPVIVTFVQTWKRNEVLRNKKKFRNIFVSEDFPKDVLEKRKLWLDELKEERKKGKIAYLVYDKLLVKPGKLEKSDKEEFNNEEDLSQLLDEIEQEEEAEKKPWRRAKAMINRNKTLSDDEKPGCSAKERKNKNNTFSSEESEEERAAEKSRRRGKAMANKKVTVSNGESNDETDNEKTKPRKTKTIINKKNSSLDKKPDENIEDEKTKNQPMATTNKNDSLWDYTPQKRKMDY